MDELKKEVGQRIKERRKELKLATTDIKNNIGISVGFLSEIENGIKSPSLRYIVKLSEILECSTDYLLTGMEYGEEQNNDNRTKKLLSYFYAMNEDDKEEILMIAEIKARKGKVMLSDSGEKVSDNEGIA